MSQIQNTIAITVAIPLLAVLSGCSMFHPGMHAGYPPPTAQYGPGAPIETHPPAVDETLSREFAEAKVRSKELGMRLTEITAERDHLRDEVTRMQQQRASTISSITSANHEVEATRTELDQTARDVQIMRQQIQQVLDDFWRRDAAHAAQMEQFSRQLDALVNRFGDDGQVSGSYPLGRSSSLKP